MDMGQIVTNLVLSPDISFPVHFIVSPDIVVNNVNQQGGGFYAAVALLVSVLSLCVAFFALREERRKRDDEKTYNGLIFFAWEMRFDAFKVQGLANDLRLMQVYLPQTALLTAMEGHLNAASTVIQKMEDAAPDFLGQYQHILTDDDFEIFFELSQTHRNIETMRDTVRSGAVNESVAKANIDALSLDADKVAELFGRFFEKAQFMKNAARATSEICICPSVKTKRTGL